MSSKEREIFFGKIYDSIFYGILIGIFYSIIKYDKLNFDGHKNSDKNKIENRLILTEPENLTRDDIIKLGKESIRDPYTNKIMEHPYVDKEGNSYENNENLHKKENINENSNTENDKKDAYKNRALMEVIESIKK